MQRNSEQILYLINDFGPSYPSTLEYWYWPGSPLGYSLEGGHPPATHFA